MFNRDRWIEIVEALTSNWFRTVLTAFGVVWGIFILIVLLAAGKGLENGVKKDFDGIATNTMFMWTQLISKPYKGLPKGRRFTYRLDDVDAIKQQVPNLRFVSPRNRLGGYGSTNNVTRGLKAGAFNVLGDYPEIMEQQPMDMISGRFINYGDIEEKRKVAVIGEGVKNELYNFSENPIGTYLKIQGVGFMVIGVYTKNSSGRNQEEELKEIFVPFTSYAQAFNSADRVGWMAITAEDGSSITKLKSRVFEVIKERHSIHPDDDRAIGNFDLYEQYQRVEGLFFALKIVGYIIGVLVLLSGVIGVSNIMLIVVRERTKEIGIRRAIGASPWSIRGQILLESICLTIVSGMLGIIGGTGLIYLTNYILGVYGPVDMFANPSVDLTVVFISLFILITSGLLAGLIPAQVAIKTKPIDALRTE